MNHTRKSLGVAATNLLTRTLIVAAALLPMIGSAIARAEDEEKTPFDARVAGYKHLEAGGNALSWLLMAALAILCISVMFKSAKRTHLD